MVCDLRRWLFLAICVLPSCAILPSDGPRTQAVIKAGIEAEPANTDTPTGTLPYNLERLTHRNIAHVSRAPHDGLRRQFSFPASGGGSTTIEVGDTLAMTLW